MLVVGASGSIGRLAVIEALRSGFSTTALIRDANQASLFPEGTRIVVGDPTDDGALADALNEVNGIVFTQGTYRNDDVEQVNYRPVHAVLNALTSSARIALMTTLGVTKPTPGHDWKRRGERLVRASGLPYTIVRPGWFDYNASDEHRLVMRQGDTRWVGSPADGVISRQQIAEVLIASLTSDEADRKTFELVAEKGEAQLDLGPVFADLEPDSDTALNGPKDRDNLPLSAEPERVIDELRAIRDRL